MRRFYLSETIGDGTPDNPWRAAQCDLQADECAVQLGKTGKWLIMANEPIHGLQKIAVHEHEKLTVATRKWLGKVLRISRHKVEAKRSFGESVYNLFQRTAFKDMGRDSPILHPEKKNNRLRLVMNGLELFGVPVAPMHCSARHTDDFDDSAMDNWDQHVGTFVDDATDCNITHSSNSTDLYAHYDQALDSNDMEVEMTIIGQNFTSNTNRRYGAGCMGRKEDSATQTYYQWSRRAGSNNELELARINAGGFTLLASTRFSSTASFPEVLFLSVDGTTITGKQDGDTRKEDTTDGDPITDDFRHGGLTSRSGINASVSSIDVDTWSAQDVGFGAAGLVGENTLHSFAIDRAANY